MKDDTPKSHLEGAHARYNKAIAIVIIIIVIILPTMKIKDAYYILHTIYADTLSYERWHTEVTYQRYTP